MAEDRRLYTKEAMEKFEAEMAEFPNYNKNNFDHLFPGIRERDEKISSLITTIESQKEEIEGYKAITELAVKGFQVLKAMSSKDDIPPALYNSASWYLDEIARLQNE